MKYLNKDDFSCLTKKTPFNHFGIIFIFIRCFKESTSEASLNENTNMSLLKEIGIWMAFVARKS